MLELISFVGVDAYTDLIKLISYNEVWESELKQIKSFELLYEKEDHKFIEYGFLYSESRMGKDNRYPSLEFIKDGLDLFALHSIPTSVHLCGEEAIGKYLNADEELMAMCENSRIQLNFNIKKYDEDLLIQKLLYVSELHNKPLILQCNKSKASFISKLLKEVTIQGISDPNINILYDGSGGFGKEIEIVEKPFEGYFTGYAGGIKPSNVHKIMERIENSLAHAGKLFVDNFYIDMESGIRENDKLSLGLCDGIISEVNYYYST